MEKQKTREEIKDEYKWDLTPIYINDKTWYQDLEIAKEEIKKVVNYHNLLDSASNLLNYIEYSEKTERLLYKLYFYAHLNSDSDTTNTNYQKMQKLISDLMNEYSELGSYITPLFMKNDYSLIEKYYIEEPKLKEHEFNFKDMYRYQEHTLNEEHLFEDDDDLPTPEEADSEIDFTENN